jgi:hypothetical protein
MPSPYNLKAGKPPVIAARQTQAQSLKMVLMLISSIVIAIVAAGGHQ